MDNEMLLLKTLLSVEPNHQRLDWSSNAAVMPLPLLAALLVTWQSSFREFSYTVIQQDFWRGATLAQFSVGKSVYLYVTFDNRDDYIRLLDAINTVHHGDRFGLASTNRRPSTPAPNHPFSNYGGN